jgi:hypothetical protein
VPANLNKKYVPNAPVDTSRDEYPFRSTKQGAYTVSPKNNNPRTFNFCHLNKDFESWIVGYSRRFIDASQNSEGGSHIGVFYGIAAGKGKRLFSGGPFYVKIVN